MKYFVSFIILLITICGASAQRNFKPVYGTDAQINRTLAFVSEHVVFDSLTYTRLGDLKGFVRCTFEIDKEGQVYNISISKGLAFWIDYEILSAMRKLPKMEPFYNKKGEKINVVRDIYFTFNSDDDRGWGDPYDEMSNDMTAQSLAKQQQKVIDDLIKREGKWTEYTKDNTKLSLDGKTIYKPGVLPQNPLNLKNPGIKPPTRITLRSE